MALQGELRCCINLMPIRYRQSWLILSPDSPVTLTPINYSFLTLTPRWRDEARAEKMIRQALPSPSPSPNSNADPNPAIPQPEPKPTI